ncbi:MAG TPA: Xaa-Pro peptidase family protein [Opitutaceae bacterium]|nr:Xaa-Pro peptidase family protein [Opitutaceae bacterium]
MASSRQAPPLLYADTERSADALYFGRIGIPDPFLAFGLRGRKHAVVSALEFSRVRRDSEFDVVHPLEDWVKRAKAAWPRRRPGPAEVMALIARDRKHRRFTVPSDFPAGLCEKLRREGLRLTVADGPLFPQRLVKSPAEAAAIRQGNRASARGLAAAERMLRESRVRGRRLVHRGRTLTSERLKFAIEVACLEAGAVSLHTIAAGGDQACDPHEQGHGPLRPHELIVVDVFPRLQASGYFGDMTRTFLRGRASEAQRGLVAAVRAAQRAALGAIRAGVQGRDVHAQAEKVFQDRGYRTRRAGGKSVGFFHGTGHGLGLEVHEAPRVSATGDFPLPRGAVVTVEPGLYYPGLGGCRIEDVVQVGASGARLLSRHPYVWEL